MPLGTRLRYVNGHMKEVWEHGYIISLEETLNSLLAYCVENPHKSGDIFMRDFGDGNKVNIHPAISQYPDTLVIQLYTDDLEVANPLGVHTKKHKVTPFSMVLLNLRPADHSRLSAIHLVAIAKRVHLKRHGFDKLLSDFITTMNKLASDAFILNGKIYHGCLLVVVADTPATNLLRSFKEGVGFAHQPYRTCHISSSDFPINLSSTQCESRALPDHIDKFNFLFEQPHSKAARCEWSKRLGINQKSIMLKVVNFLLEGVVPNYELALLLQYSIHVKEFFTLSWLNHKLETFPYTYLEVKNKP